MSDEPNLNYLNQLSEGDETIKSRLMLVLKEEFFKEVEEYKQNMMNNNFLLASECVHKIRHKIGFLGMYNDYELSNQYQQNLEDNSINLKDDFEKVLNIISEFILKY